MYFGWIFVSALDPRLGTYLAREAQGGLNRRPHTADGIFSSPKAARRQFLLKDESAVNVGAIESSFQEIPREFRGAFLMPLHSAVARIKRASLPLHVARLL